MADEKPQVALHMGEVRAQFEEWARTHNYILSRFEASGDYQYATTACAWHAWQAAHTAQAQSAQPLVRSPVMNGDDFDNLVETEAGNYGDMLEDGGWHSGWSFSCEALIEFSRAMINGWGMHRHMQDYPSPAAQGDSRLSFEAWAQSHGFDVTKDRGIYNTLETRSAWEAWLHWQRLSDSLPVTQDPNPSIAVIQQAMEHFPENSWMRGALDHAAAELAVLHRRQQNSAQAISFEASLARPLNNSGE